MDSSVRLSTERLFPPVSENLYTQVFGFKRPQARARPIEMFWKHRLDPKTTFLRVVHFCRSAFEAELDGVWDRADFYYAELTSWLADLPPAHPCWASGRRLVFPEREDLSGAGFRHALLTQVVLDSLVGLVRGQLAAGNDPLHRPSGPLVGIANLLPNIPDYTIEMEGALIDTIAGEAAASLQKTNPEVVERLWIRLAELFPRQPQYLDNALAEISPKILKQLESVDQSLRVNVVQKSILELESIRRRFPNNITCYDLIGMLFWHQTALIGGSSLPDAYLALAKAESYGGPRAEFAAVRGELDQILTALRREVVVLRANISASLGTRQLTAEGRRLMADADAGDKRGNDWKRSSEARKIRAGREAASKAENRTFEPGDSDVLPLLAAKTVKKEVGHEPLSDWLNSGRAARVRLQLVAALILALVAAVMLGREIAGSYFREEAWKQAQKAARSGSDVATLDALSDYFDATNALWKDQDQEREAIRLYGKTLAHWLTSATRQQLSDADKKRLSKYREQIAKPGLDLREVTR